MGGFTQILLKDCSQSNIDEQNEKLDELKVNKSYRFYSGNDVFKQYKYFLKGEGNWDERFFPKDKIKSYNDFKKYWSPEALGEIFVPQYGTLQFDCYFGRTSKRAMNGIATYLSCNYSQIKSVRGSFSTFVERCGKHKNVKKELMLLEK